MVQPHNKKEVLCSVHYRVATYCQRNPKTGWIAKKFLTKPAMRAFFVCTVIL